MSDGVTGNCLMWGQVHSTVCRMWRQLQYMSDVEKDICLMWGQMCLMGEQVQYIYV
jgi:hypothetical protein